MYIRVDKHAFFVYAWYCVHIHVNNFSPCPRTCSVSVYSLHVPMFGNDSVVFKELLRPLSMLKSKLALSRVCGSLRPSSRLPGRFI